MASFAERRRSKFRSRAHGAAGGAAVSGSGASVFRSTPRSSALKASVPETVGCGSVKAMSNTPRALLSPRLNSAFSNFTRVASPVMVLFSLAALMVLPGQSSSSVHSRTRCREGAALSSVPCRKALPTMSACPLKESVSGALLTERETLVLPPASMISGSSLEASTAMLSPCQMPLAESVAERSRAGQLSVPVTLLKTGGRLTPLSTMTRPSTISTVAKLSSGRALVSGSAGLAWIRPRVASTD